MPTTPSTRRAAPPPPLRPHVRRATLALAALLALLPVQASAWGFYAHRTTADIALDNVRPETRAGIARLMRAAPQLGVPQCDLADLQDASVWPDCLRSEGWRWGYTFAWHYRTAPVCEAYNPRSNCSGGNCILAQIERNQRILADESLPPNVRGGARVPRPFRRRCAYAAAFRRQG